MDYNSAIEYLYNSLPVFHQVGAAAYKPGLHNTIQLMNALDSPQNKYKTIHVAGTNGKGSVSYMLSAVLQTAGYKTGLYTSPHLVDFRERIRINGKKISKKYVSQFVFENKQLFEEIKPSFFESTMAMAFKYFADKQVDIAIIEVGLGGRLDSTNIINPELSVITNIGLDHTEFLGNTLEKIAGEKAGIIKPKTPVVIGETQPETLSVFIEKAKKENSKIVFADVVKNVKFIGYKDDYMFVKTSNFDKLKIGLAGDYQLKNVATVLASIDELQNKCFEISKMAIKKGLKNVIRHTGFMGRWQTLQKNPKVIIDTGHNKPGMEYVAHQLKHQTYNKLHIIIGMVNDKDAVGVLSLLPKSANYYFTNAQTKRAIPANELKEIGEKIGLQGNTYLSVESAVKSALAQAHKKDLIFIGGSNYTVGEALPMFVK